MKISKKILCAVVAFNLLIVANAQTQDAWQPVKNTDETAKVREYQNYINLPALQLKSPTLINVLFNATENLYGAAVFDRTTRNFIYSENQNNPSNGPRIVSITDQSGMQYYQLFDNNTLTNSSFYIENGTKIRLTVTHSAPINSDTLFLTFGSNVTMPTSVAVYASLSGKETFLVSRSPLNTETITFPAVQSAVWMVDLTYSQPLRISEISFRNTEQNLDNKSVKFLALPAHDYSVYSNQEVYKNNFDAYDIPNLAGATLSRNLGPYVFKQNELFTPRDEDKDGIPDSKDNCLSVSNPDQSDLNNNQRGDVCDDDDLDGIINSKDNCRNIANYDQRDTDSDGTGDKCDSDESRFTEKYPVVVWAVLGLVTIVFIGLLFIVSKKIKDNNIPTNPTK